MTDDKPRSITVYRSTSGRTVRLMVVSTLLGVGAAACGDDDAKTLTGPRAQEYGDGSTALIAGTSEGGSDARLSGDLAKGPGGCIGVDVGGRTIVVVFGNKTVVDNQDFRLRLDGKNYELGDRVELGGGSESPPYPSRIPEPPAACISGSGELFIAN